jgi:hypothetical protein
VRPVWLLHDDRRAEQQMQAALPERLQKGEGVFQVVEQPQRKGDVKPVFREFEPSVEVLHPDLDLAPKASISASRPFIRL